MFELFGLLAWRIIGAREESEDGSGKSQEKIGGGLKVIPRKCDGSGEWQAAAGGKAQKVKHIFDNHKHDAHHTTSDYYRKPFCHSM